MSTTIPASHRDLLEAPTGVLATVGPDGRPQVSAVWFLAEDDTVRISLNTSRQKVKNLRADPSVSFFVLDVANPARYLELRGDGELADDPESAFASQLGAKYDADVRSFDPPGSSRIVVTIHPVRVHAVDMGSG